MTPKESHISKLSVFLGAPIEPLTEEDAERIQKYENDYHASITPATWSDLVQPFKGE